jgi:hypothetical protein
MTASGTSSRSRRRRSTRFKMKIPLTIQAGSGSQLQGETVCVSKHGASIRITTGGSLTCGDSLQVTLRSNRQAQTAHVVWVDKAGAPLCAIELEQATDFWGIRFPGATAVEWRPAPKPAPELPAAEPLAAGVAPPALNQAATPAVVVYPLSDPGFVSATFMPEPGSATGTATITGLSAVHSLLAEKVQVVFTEPGEALVFLCNLVEPGTKLRLFLSKDKAVLARVVSIGDKREGGKWRVRVRYEAN